MGEYRRLTDGLNRVGKLIPANENPYNYITDTSKDWYLSIYKYNDSHKKLAEQTITVEKVDKKTKEKIKYERDRGIDGIEDVTTNILVFDVDSKHDLTKAKLDCITICERLDSYGIPYDQQNISFSGGKGFSVVVEHDIELTPEEHKSIAESIAGDLETFDTVNYNASRIFRLNHTKHNKSGLYKTPLSFNELKSLGIDSIKKLATEEYSVVPMVKTSLPKKIQNLKTVKKEEQKPVIEKVKTLPENLEIDFSKKPYYLSDLKYVLQCGYIPEGRGNEGMMVLCATYRHVGMDKVDAYHLLKSVNEKRSEIYGIERRTNDEIWEQVIATVYSPAWRGGTYTKDQSDLLEEIATKFNIVEHNKVVTTKDMIKQFYIDMENISKNTIKTGIKPLDREIRITPGMMVGLLAAPSAGKCLGRGTLIRMFDGSLKKVEDIQIGDILMGDDSSPRNVLSICSGRENLYKIKQENGNDYIVNESHILSLKNNVNFTDSDRKKQFKKEVVDISILDYLKQGKLFKKHYKGYKVGVEYNEKSLEMDPYLMGLWLGDGTSSKPEITTADEKILNYLILELCEKNGLFINNYNNQITYTFTSQKGPGGSPVNKFLNHLRGYEVLNNKHIPLAFKINSRTNRLKLLAGLIDSDGFYDSRRNSYEITQKNKRLTDDIVDLVRSLGFRCSINKKIAKYKSATKGKLYEGATEVFRLHISGDNLEEIPVLLERKKANSQNKTAKLLTKITVESIGEGEYFGFEIDGNRRFLLEDYTVTHNTSIATSIIEAQAKLGMNPGLLSMDMDRGMMTQRLIQRCAGINIEPKIRKIDKNDEFYDPEYDIKKDPVMLDAVDKFHNTYKPVSFDYTRGANLESIEEFIKAQKMLYGNNFNLLVVDYLEKVRGPYTDATANSGYVASRLSDLAATYSVAIILLLQPQKSAGDPSEELLSMRKVKGASVIEQDCRVILTMWRPGFDPQNVYPDNFASIAVVKNNMGRITQVDLGWDGAKGEVYELNHEQRKRLKDLIEERKEKKKEQENEAW